MPSHAPPLILPLRHTPAPPPAPPCRLTLCPARCACAPLACSHLFALNGFPALVGRSGARLAEAVSIAAHPPSRKMLKRMRAAAAAAGAAAAAPPRQAEAAQDDSGGSSGAAEGRPPSGGTSVVSAPDWPPVRQQHTAAPADGSQQQQQEEPHRRGHKQQQARQRAADAPAAAAAGGQTAADVRSFLRHSGGGTALPLQAWEDAAAEAKRHKAVLERQVGGEVPGWRDGKPRRDQACHLSVSSVRLPILSPPAPLPCRVLTRHVSTSLRILAHPLSSPSLPAGVAQAAAAGRLRPRVRPRKGQKGPLQAGHRRWWRGWRRRRRRL